MESAPDWIVLAQILRPQGRKGEVLADLFTDFPERFATHPRVWLAPAGFAERPAGRPDPAGPSRLDQHASSPAEAEIVEHWLPLGRNAGRIVLRFAGVESIEEAEQLANKEVILPLSERVPLEPGAAYVSDLVGSTVYDGELALGVVETVEFPASADGSRRLEEAAALLAVRSPEGDEILVPFANAFLVELDVGAKTLRMKLPEGLAEINKSSQLARG